MGVTPHLYYISLSISLSLLLGLSLSLSRSLSLLVRRAVVPPLFLRRLRGRRGDSWRCIPPPALLDFFGPVDPLFPGCPKASTNTDRTMAVSEMPLCRDYIARVANALWEPTASSSMWTSHNTTMATLVVWCVTTAARNITRKRRATRNGTTKEQRKQKKQTLMLLWKSPCGQMMLVSW
jgi:hypothetical protein